MKKIFMLLATAFIAVSGLAQTVLYSCDFNDSKKVDMTYYDVDKLTPTKFMSNIGFAIDKPWIPCKDSNTSTNTFICSTSQYNPAGQANDWMVTPAIKVTKNCILEWYSQAYKMDARDGLKVFISTIGNTPADFPAEPVWAVEEEEVGPTEDFDGEFIHHSLTLDEYAGQTIYVAFVNQSYNKSLLGVDDIKVYRNEDFVVSLNFGEVVFENEEIEVAGYITNYKIDNINEVNFTLTYGEETINETISGLNIAKGGKQRFALEHKIAIDLNESIDYTLIATVGDKQYSIASSVTNTFFRQVVFEEHTGIRCGYCPAGTWAIDSLKEVAGEHLAPIAVQCSSLGSAALMVENYTGHLYSEGITNYPAAWIDRTYIKTPFGSNSGYSFDVEDSWISLFYKQLATMAEAGISTEARLTEDLNTINITTHVRTAEDKQDLDWRVIYALTEDSLAGFFQKNDYAGSKYYVGGWEKKKNTVEVVLDDVARGIYPSFYGLQGSIPANINKGDVAEHTYSIDLTELDLYNVYKLNIIAMLVDGKTKRVVNAHKVHVQDHTGIEGIQADAMPVRVVANNGRVEVSTFDNTPFTASLITIDGRVIATEAGMGSATLNAAGYHGVALVQIVSDNNMKVTRVVVR